MTAEKTKMANSLFQLPCLCAAAVLCCLLWMLDLGRSSCLCSLQCTPHCMCMNVLCVSGRMRGQRNGSLEVMWQLWVHRADKLQGSCCTHTRCSLRSRSGSPSTPSPQLCAAGAAVKVRSLFPCRPGVLSCFLPAPYEKGGFVPQKEAPGESRGHLDACCFPRPLCRVQREARAAHRQAKMRGRDPGSQGQRPRLMLGRRSPSCRGAEFASSKAQEPVADRT